VITFALVKLIEMKILFSKYQGTGNDFIMLDNLNGQYDALTIENIQFICDRRFGIGADGLIKINAHPTFDFEVDYYNSDGSKSFCGNGARCSVAFAETLGIDVSKTSFLGIDGAHIATKVKDVISIEMSNVSEVQQIDEDYVIQTGSPHYVRFIESKSHLNIVEFGKSIRYSDQFKEKGINVNSVEVINDKNLIVNTYERGVEDETLSCGTGVTACVLAFAHKNKITGSHIIKVQVKGGNLEVSFNQVAAGVFEDIQLVGPGTFVFSGAVHV